MAENRGTGGCVPWEEFEDMRAWGDRMQSEASRVVTWIDDNAGRIPAMGYEASMAKIAVFGLIADWTRMRTTAPMSERQHGS